LVAHKNRATQQSEIAEIREIPTEHGMLRANAQHGRPAGRCRRAARWCWPCRPRSRRTRRSWNDARQGPVHGDLASDDDNLF
jgi:hypothetical protein